VPSPTRSAHCSSVITQDTVVTLDLQCRLSPENHLETPGIKVLSPSVACDSVKIEPLKVAAAPALAEEPRLPLSEAMTASSEVAASQSSSEAMICLEASAAKSSELATCTTTSEAAASSDTSEEISCSVLSKAGAFRPLSEAVSYSVPAKAETSSVVSESCSTSPVTSQSTSKVLPSKAVTCGAPLLCPLPLEAPTSRAPSETVIGLTSPRAVKLSGLTVVLERMKMDILSQANTIIPCTSSIFMTNSLEASEPSKMAAFSLCEPCTVPSSTSRKSSVSETEVAVTGDEQDESCLVLSEPTVTSEVKLELPETEVPSVEIVVPCVPCTMPSDCAESLPVKSEPGESEVPGNVVGQQDADGGQQQVTETLHESVSEPVTRKADSPHTRSVTIATKEPTDVALDVGRVKCERVQLDQQSELDVVAVISQSSLTSMSSILTAVHITTTSVFGSSESMTSTTTMISDSSSVTSTVTSVSSTLTHESTSLTSLSSVMSPVLGGAILTSGIFTPVSTTLTSVHDTPTSSSVQSSSLTSVTNIVMPVCTTVTHTANTTKSVPGINTGVSTPISNVASVPGSITSLTSLHNKLTIETCSITSGQSTATSTVTAPSSIISSVPYTVTSPGFTSSALTGHCEMACHKLVVSGAGVTGDNIRLSSLPTSPCRAGVTGDNIRLSSLPTSPCRAGVTGDNIRLSSLPTSPCRAGVTGDNIRLSSVLTSPCRAGVTGDNIRLSSVLTSPCRSGVTGDNIRLSSLPVSPWRLASHSSRITAARGSVMSLDDSTSEDELHIVLHDNSFTASESAADTSLPVSVPARDSSTACDQTANDTLLISVPNDKSSSGSDNADSSLREAVCIKNDVVIDSPINKCPVMLLHDSATVNVLRGATVASQSITVTNTDGSSEDLMPSIAGIVAELSLFCPLSPIPNCQHCDLCDAASVDDSAGGTRVMIHRKRAVALKHKLSEQSDDDDVISTKVSAPSNYVRLSSCSSFCLSCTPVAVFVTLCLAGTAMLGIVCLSF